MKKLVLSSTDACFLASKKGIIITELIFRKVVVRASKRQLYLWLGFDVNGNVVAVSVCGKVRSMETDKVSKEDFIVTALEAVTINKTTYRCADRYERKGKTVRLVV